MVSRNVVVCSEGGGELLLLVGGRESDDSVSGSVGVLDGEVTEPGERKEDTKRVSTEGRKL